MRATRALEREPGAAGKRARDARRQTTGRKIAPCLGDRHALHDVKRAFVTPLGKIIRDLGVRAEGSGPSPRSRASTRE